MPNSKEYGDITYEEIVLAALLHDIGKIAQRAEDTSCNIESMEAQILPKAHNGVYYTHKHALYTYGALLKIYENIQFIPDNIRPTVVAKLAAMHHNPSDWPDYIISESDKLSSGSDRIENQNTKEQEISYFKRAQQQALLSVFSLVNLKNKPKAHEMYYDLKPLKDMNVYPSKDNIYSKEKYKTIWEGLKNDIRAIKEKDFEHYLAALDTILEHWTWSIPSSTIDQPDISLYDHARTTASFATVLFRWHEKINDFNSESIKNRGKEKYALITGDMSGIQNYLFDLKNTLKNAKILRARSFEIRAITDSVTRLIIDKFKTNRFTLLSSAGGRFTLLLPNIEQAQEIVHDIQRQVDHIFLKKYLGNLALCISDIEFATFNDFLLNNNNFKNLFDRLQSKSRLSKLKKLQNGILQNGPILDFYYNAIQSKSVCSMCDAKPIADNILEPFCEDCYELAKLGEKLPKAQSITINKNGKGIKLINDEYIYLNLNDDKTLKGKMNVNVYKPGEAIIRLPYTVPRNADGSVIEFDVLSQLSEGTPYLAMFKADLDNLGLVFSSGLSNNLSISRFVSLSRMLDYFFSVRIREIIENNNNYKQSIYCVYSGGDDVCVLGPWNRVIDFSKEVQSEFERFTGNNNCLTISGGISLCHVGLPIKRLADMAEDQLEIAKNTTNKNSISVINLPLPWNEFSKQIEKGLYIKELLKKKNISTAFIYNLLIYSKKAEDFKNGNIHKDNILWHSHYNYTLKRFFKYNKINDENIQNYLKSLSTEIGNMINARVAVTYALYAQRLKAKDKEE